MQKRKEKTGSGKHSPTRKSGAAVKANVAGKGPDGTFGRHYTSPLAGLDLSVLNLQPITRLELAMSSGGRTKTENAILKTIDNETKQLQAIEDLYAVLRAQPKYKNLKEPNWKATTPPLDVLKYILRKLGTLADGQYWSVDTYQSAGRTRYMFVIYRYYHNQLVSGLLRHMPLDFLPWLNKKEPVLHDIILDVVALVHKHAGIPLWWNDGDYSEGLWKLKQMDPVERDNNQRMHAQWGSYTSGLAAQYQKLIKDRISKATLPGLKRKLSGWHAKSYRQETMQWWVKMGIDLVESSDNLANYTFIPNFTGNAKTAVGPSRKYKFVWSDHSYDYCHIVAEKKLEKEQREYGFYYPMEVSRAKPGQILKPLTMKQWQFPCHVHNFFKTGIGTLRRHSDYYYKRSYHDKRTVAEIINDASKGVVVIKSNTLIEVLTDDEIKQAR